MDRNQRSLTQVSLFDDSDLKFQTHLKSPKDPKSHKSESERRSWFLDPDRKLTKIQVWIQFSNYSNTSGNE